jgi:hypothetical protein
VCTCEDWVTLWDVDVKSAALFLNMLETLLLRWTAWEEGIYSCERSDSWKENWCVCVFVVWFRPLLQKVQFLSYGSLFKCVWTLQNKNSCLLAVCRKQWWTIAWLDVCCILKCLYNALMPATKFTIVLMLKMWWGLKNRCSFKCICDDNRCRHKLVWLHLSVANWKKSELTLVHSQFLSVLAHWIMKEAFALYSSVTDQQKSGYVFISHFSPWFCMSWSLFALAYKWSQQPIGI